MVEMNMIQALNSALDIQLKNDDSVIIFGEDVGFFGEFFVLQTHYNKNMENTVFLIPSSRGRNSSNCIWNGNKWT